MTRLTLIASVARHYRDEDAYAIVAHIAGSLWQGDEGGYSRDHAGVLMDWADRLLTRKELTGSGVAAEEACITTMGNHTRPLAD